MLEDDERKEQVEGVVRVIAAEAEDGGKYQNDDGADCRRCHRQTVPAVPRVGGRWAP